MSRIAQPALAADTVAAGGVRMDRAPVTNERYAAFLEATGHRAPAYWSDGRAPATLRDHPVVGVDYFDAVAFARWAGGCLPTEYEWVLATGLDEPRAYPWGDAFDSARCNTLRSGRKGTSPVGAYPPAPSGCVDLCGNTWELTCNAGARDEATVLVKGGSWFDFPAHAKIDASFRAPVTGRSSTVGFRLCYGREERHPAGLDAGSVDRAIRARRGNSACEEPIRPLVAPETPTGIALERSERDRAIALLEPTPAVLPMSRNGRQRQALGACIASLGWMQRMLAQRGAVLLTAGAGSVLLVATTLVTAMSTDAPVRAEHARTGDAGAAVTRAVATDAAAERRPPASVRIRRIPLEPGDDVRAAAPARAKTAADAREEILRRLDAATSETERRRIRFELAAADERRDGAGEPIPVTVLPTRGLVFACRLLEAPQQQCIEVVRRLGRAHGIDVTIVYSGDEPIGEWIAKHRATLGGVYVVPDRADEFKEQFELASRESVLQLRPDGRPVFVLPGMPTRDKLERRLETRP